jgi:putative hydrolase of the HAD superfamily
MIIDPLPPPRTLQTKSHLKLGMNQGILFDFGGTLDSDGGHWLDRNYLTYTHLGLTHIDKTKIKEAFYWADRQAEADAGMRTAPYRDMMVRHYRWQFEKLGLKDTSKEAEAVSFFVRHAERVLRRNRKVLETLHHSNYRLGVVSNSYGNIETLCREFGYNSYVSVFIDSLVEGISKPDPRIYQLALDRIALPAAQVWMVGDNFERDIIPAKSLGLRTAWLIGDHRRTPPDPTQVDLILRSLEELPERLNNWKAVSA